VIQRSGRFFTGNVMERQLKKRFCSTESNAALSSNKARRIGLNWDFPWHNKCHIGEDMEGLKIALSNTSLRKLLWCDDFSGLLLLDLTLICLVFSSSVIVALLCGLKYSVSLNYH